MAKRGPKPKTKEIIWSPKLAYAVGLMASDGCLSPDGRHFIFVSKDIDQIENLKNCLGLTVKTGRTSSGKAPEDECYRLQWGDVQLYSFLLSIGLTSNKSLTLGKIDVPDEYFFDFLRGHFDGDGSFYSYFDPRWKSSFMFYVSIACASKDFIDWIQETTERLLGIKGHVTSASKNVMYQMRYAKKESLILLNTMYKNT